MKSFLRFIWGTIEVIVIIYVILLTVFILSKNKYGYTQIGDYVISPIESTDVQNIKDTKQGDLLIVKNTSDINVGDVIYYYAINNKKYIICSTDVTKVSKDDYSAVYSINDGANGVVVSEKVLGKYATTYHNIGSFISFVQGRIGFLFCVLLPIMIIFIYQIYDFVIILRFEGLEDEEEEEKDKEKDNNKHIEEEHKEVNKFKFDDSNE